MHRSLSQVSLALAALCSLGVCGVSASAQPVTVNLGQSAENFTLTGTGGIGSYGTYNITQGACSSGGGLTTCNLTGAFTGTTPGYTGGTYDFQTTYASSTTYFPVQGESIGPQGSSTFNEFSYDYFDPSVNMTLDLSDAGMNYALPLVINGNLATNLTSLSFAFVTATCGGTSLGTLPCSQGDVGLVNGAFITGPTTGVDGLNLTVTTPPVTPPTATTPEPGWLSLSGLPMVGYFLNRRKAMSSN